MDALDLIDLGETGAAARFVDACETIGFAVLTGHDIDVSCFEAMRAMLGRLFDVDDDRKHALAITSENYRGFIPLGLFTPNRLEVNGAQPDQYEGYKLHWECPAGDDECALYGPNVWATHVPDMADTVLRYWTACDRLAEQLLRICAEAMGVDGNQFVAWHDRPLTNMTLLHYPAHPPANPVVGIHPHKDTNVLTFLHPDPVGGLEVRGLDGSWIDVDAPPEGLVVNIGEMLELWSGGRFVATPHRVINRSGQERYSFPYFVVPNHAVVVEPLIAPVDGFGGGSMPVGHLSAEVWRTNWPDEQPTADYDLGSLRSSDL